MKRWSATLGFFVGLALLSSCASPPDKPSAPGARRTSSAPSGEISLTAAETSLDRCTNNSDDDGDGSTDCEDSGCASFCTDADGDGYCPVGQEGGTIDGVCTNADIDSATEDCDDTVATGTPIYPGAPENTLTLCTDTADNDCDGTQDDAEPDCVGFYTDDDNDTYCEVGREKNPRDGSCDFGDVDNTTEDCDDGDDTQHPGAPEDTFALCTNGIDNNCDGISDSAEPSCAVYYTDDDGDGFCETGPVSVGITCLAVDADPANRDCDDGDSARNPGAPENTLALCTNTIDDDCDGLLDESEPSCAVFYTDIDNDGYCQTGPVSAGVTCLFADLDLVNADCDDSNPSANPGAAENTVSTCTDNFDNDCDGDVDPADTAGCGALYLDDDGDGYCEVGQETGTIDGTCGVADINSTTRDCDDGNINISPSATERDIDQCTDGVDNNCDGSIDNAAADCMEFYTDADGDGYCPIGQDSGGTGTCVSADVDLATRDCDDTDPTRSPGILEDNLTTCTDGSDNDCDLDQDCADSDCFTLCTDNDNDGYCEVGEQISSGPRCQNSDIDSSTRDCDDLAAVRYPTHTEVPGDGIDQDCDLVDDCWPDLDDDGDGDDTSTASAAIADCSGPGDGWATTQTDCNDLEPTVSLASGVENTGPLCSDTLDNDCDTLSDLGDPDCGLPSIDNDGDGYCESLVSCDAGAIPGDCDDSDPDISPVDPEDDATLCLDGADNDCDGLVDQLDLDSCSLANIDNDGDGVCEGGQADTDGDGLCTDPSPSPDCDDNDPAAFPGNPEADPAVCADGIDNDCDGLIDSIDPDCGGYFDGDGDGYCAQSTCTGGLSPNDCDDGDSAIYPGAPETPADDIDQDCNGVDDCYRDDDDDDNGVDQILAGLSLDCDADANRSSTLTDCDDTNPAVYTGATEVVGNGIDEDCDGFDTCFQDFDGDGFGSLTPVIGADLSCSGPGESVRSDDCDDTDASEFPSQNFYPDCDADGFFVGVALVACQRSEADALSGCGSPTGGYVFAEPAVPDQDCDDTDDSEFPNQVWYADCDGDSIAQSTPLSACSAEAATAATPCADTAAPDGGWVHLAPAPADCDDENAARSPLLDEICEATGEVQVDNDCDGSVNTDADGTEPANSQIFFTDCDRDGFGEPCPGGDSSCTQLACEATGTIVSPTCPQGAALVTNNADCNDSNDTVFPGASEICDDIDQNCNGLVDEVDFLDPDISLCIELYRDRDGDGYGDQGATQCLCASDGNLSVEYDNELYVATFSDCDDLHADIRPHECNDGRDNDGDGLIDEGDSDCAPRLDGGVLKQPVTESGTDEFLTELLDGHDNDCDGFVPLIELDCDDDGALPLLPIPTNTGFYTAEEVGLARCTGGPIQQACWGETLTLECDAVSGLWVTRWAASDDGFGGRYSNAYRNLNSTGCAGTNDCDDTCAARCEGVTEVCDGIDNDCSGIAPEVDDDGIPAALGEEIVIGTVSEAEEDKDGDGYAACIDDFRTTDAQIQITTAACASTVVPDFDSDCNDLCYLANAQATESCNGFTDVCDAALALVEGTDADQDGHSTCGAFGVVDNELDERFYVPVWLAGPGAPAGTEPWIPLMLPRADERATECDGRLADNLASLLAGTGTELADLIEDSELVTAVCPSGLGGECGIVELTYDPAVDTLEADVIEDVLAAGFTDIACADRPEQYLSRSVWGAERLTSVRRAVVQEECIRLYGTGCEEIPTGAPRIGSPLQPDLSVVVDDGYRWWQEVGRFTPRLATGAVMTCWGDPRDGLRTIDETVGGDCADDRGMANRDTPEGPDDLLGLYLGEGGDCSQCTDGIDNNCDGRIDCEDPSCAVCFVGVGRGCNGLKDPCNPDADGGGCQSSPMDGVAPIFGVLLLLFRTRTRRRSASLPR